MFLPRARVILSLLGRLVPTCLFVSRSVLTKQRRGERALFPGLIFGVPLFLYRELRGKGILQGDADLDNIGIFVYSAQPFACVRKEAERMVRFLYLERIQGKKSAENRQNRVCFFDGCLHGLWRQLGRRYDRDNHQDGHGDRDGDRRGWSGWQRGECRRPRSGRRGRGFGLDHDDGQRWLSDHNDHDPDGRGRQRRRCADDHDQHHHDPDRDGWRGRCDHDDLVDEYHHLDLHDHVNQHGHGAKEGHVARLRRAADERQPRDQHLRVHGSE